MKSVILVLKGSSMGDYAPNQDQIKNIFEPWFVKRGWRIIDRMFSGGSVTLLSLVGEDNVSEVDSSIDDFYEYIQERYKDFKDNEKAGYPSLYLRSGIEVVYSAMSSERDGSIFSVMALRYVLECIPGEVRTAEEAIDRIGGRFTRR